MNCVMEKLSTTQPKQPRPWKTGSTKLNASNNKSWTPVWTWRELCSFLCVNIFYMPYPQVPELHKDKPHCTLYPRINTTQRAWIIVDIPLIMAMCTRTWIITMVPVNLSLWLYFHQPGLPVNQNRICTQCIIPFLTFSLTFQLDNFRLFSASHVSSNSCVILTGKGAQPTLEP